MSEREEFNRQLRNIIETKNKNNVYLSRQTYEDIMSEVQQAKLKTHFKTPLDYRRLRRYDIITVGEEIKLISPLLDDNNPTNVKYFVTTEELYDVIHKVHLATGHGGRNRLSHELNEKYRNVTVEAIMLYLSLCQPCQLKSSYKRKGNVDKPGTENQFNYQCQVDLIEYNGRCFLQKPMMDATVIKTEPDSSEYNSQKHHQCRLCAKTFPSVLDIYGEQGSASHLSEKINQYLPTKVSPLDHLPLFCCWNCYHTVIGWDEFVGTCLNSEKMLTGDVNVDNEDMSVNINKVARTTGCDVNVENFDQDMCAVKGEVVFKEEVNSEIISEDDFHEDGKDDDEFVLKCEVESENELMLDENEYQGHSLASNESEEDDPCDPLSNPNQILEMHVSTKDHHDKTKRKDIACEHCKTAFSSDTELKSHVCAESEDVLCEDADVDAVDLESAENHRCGQCQLKFKSSRGLQIHSAKRHYKVLSQRDVKPACETKDGTCEHCGKVFKSDVNYRSHIYSMHTENPQPLTQAEKWRDWELMKGECRVVDDFNKVLYKCPECSKLFIKASFLMSHQTTHTGAQLYSCKQCDTKFSHRQSLSSHIKAKHRDKAFECQVCGVKCGKKSCLVDHMLVHSEKKSFICEKCGKSFAQRNGLKMHLRCHPDWIPLFECKLCKRSFSKEFGYRRHMELHNINRPHQCKECKAHFQTEKDVEEHMVKHKGGDKFFCEYCGSCFSRKNNYSKHYRMCIYRFS